MNNAQIIGAIVQLSEPDFEVTVRRSSPTPQFTMAYQHH